MLLIKKIKITPYFNKIHRQYRGWINDDFWSVEIAFLFSEVTRWLRDHLIPGYCLYALHRIRIKVKDLSISWNHHQKEMFLSLLCHQHRFVLKAREMNINRHIHDLSAFMWNPIESHLLPPSTNPTYMVIDFIFFNELQTFDPLVHLRELHLLVNFIIMSSFRVTVDVNIRL